MLSLHDIPATTGSNGVPAHRDGQTVDCGEPFQLQLTDTYQITVNSSNVGPFSYQFTLPRQ
jgi:hypothetical protein